MFASRNPFTPSFGTSPPVLAGRADLLDDWETALESGPKHPDYTLFLIGQRGVGKTALLNALEDIARQRQWSAISEVATSSGLLSRIKTAATRVLSDLDPSRNPGRITGVQMAGVGIEFGQQRTSEPAPDLRQVLTRLGRLLGHRGAGLLITIDELQAANLDDIRRFGNIIQLITRREGHPIAFACAGIPSIEDRLLSGDEATFLQRCSRWYIGPLDDQAAATAIAAPIQQLDASISPDALTAAVQAVSGYAFMTQLVGYHMWKAATDPYRGIILEEALRGIAEAERRMARLVVAPIWNHLSDMDRRFLLAMASDPEESKLVDVASRLEVTTGYAGVYRNRLIKAGMITPVRKGWIAFEHHATRQWLRQVSGLEME